MGIQGSEQDARFAAPTSAARSTGAQMTPRFQLRRTWTWYWASSPKARCVTARSSCDTAYSSKPRASLSISWAHLNGCRAIVTWRAASTCSMPRTSQLERRFGEHVGRRARQDRFGLGRHTVCSALNQRSPIGLGPTSGSGHGKPSAQTWRCTIAVAANLAVYGRTLTTMVRPSASCRPSTCVSQAGLEQDLCGRRTERLMTPVDDRGSDQLRGVRVCPSLHG
jgi:hypothetical protein